MYTQGICLSVFKSLYMYQICIYRGDRTSRCVCTHTYSHCAGNLLVAMIDNLKLFNTNTSILASSRLPREAAQVCLMSNSNNTHNAGEKKEDLSASENAKVGRQQMRSGQDSCPFKSGLDAAMSAGAASF